MELLDFKTAEKLIS